MTLAASNNIARNTIGGARRVRRHRRHHRGTGILSEVLKKVVRLAAPALRNVGHNFVDKAADYAVSKAGGRRKRRITHRRRAIKPAILPYLGSSYKLVGSGRRKRRVTRKRQAPYVL